MNIKQPGFFFILFLFYGSLSLYALNPGLERPSYLFGDTIAIASEPDYPPYCMVNEQGEACGFSIDLFKAAAQAAGLQVKIRIGIWNQIKHDLEDGRIDALPMVGRTPERETRYDFTMPYMSLHGAVFIRKGTKDIHSLKDLKEKSVVVMKGDNAEEFLRREKIAKQVVTTPTFDDAFIALANGNHDAVLTQRVMGIELLKNLGIKNVIPLDFHIPQFRQDFCFAVQKGDTVLLSRLNEGLSVIIANNTFERIRDGWFGPRFKEKVAFVDILRILLFFLIPLIIIVGLVAIYVLRKEVKRRTKGLQQEVIGHKKTLEALQASEEKYRGMIMNLMEGFYSVSLDGIILDHNAEFCRILKLDPENEYRGNSLDQFWEHPDDRKIYLEAILEKGLIRNYEICAQCSTGEKIIVLASARLVRDDYGNVLSIEGSFLDITQRKLAETELHAFKENLEKTVAERTAELREKVEKLHQSEQAMLYMVEDLKQITAELQDERQKLIVSNKELETFAYSVSHDLRAPLRAIEGFGKFLVEDYSGKLGVEGNRYIEVIRQNTSKMDRLISDLLNLSRIFRAEMHKTTANIGEIVKTVFDEIATVEEKNDFELKIEDLPTAYCDVALIRQVWQNLICNALKYSSKSMIKKIEIGASTQNQEIVFYIKDYGAGFDNNYIGKLFGVFQRLHSEAEFHGTGVGLAIVQHIVQRHGGKVWAGGEVGKGATFYFSLPEKGNG